MLKMLGAVDGLFLVSLLPFCDLKNQIWMGKGVFIFQRCLNVRSIESIETIDSSLHYRYCYGYFIFTIDPSLSPHKHRDASIVRCIVTPLLCMHKTNYRK